MTHEVRVRRRLALLGLVAGGSVVTLLWAFGSSTACSTEYSCTETLCPGTCGRITRTAWVTVGALVASGAVGVLGRRRRIEVGAAVAAAIALTVGLVRIGRW